MALLTVEGIYQGGKIELTETPAGIGEATRVLVTFLSANGMLFAEDDTVQRESDASCEDVVARILADMDEGLDFGDLPYPKREDLYDRVQRYDASDH